MYESFFVETWPWWGGGIAVALIAIFVPLFVKQFMGASSSYSGMCSVVSSNPFFQTDAHRDRGRLLFGIGIVGGAMLATLLATGGWSFHARYGMIDTLLAEAPALKYALIFGGGLLVGYGARMAGGCTSGNAISGIPRRSPQGIAATAMFMLSGFLVMQAVYAIF